jgi:hypothetical protein
LKVTPPRRHPEKRAVGVGERAHHSFVTAGDIFGMWIAYDKFAKIDPKDTVDKLNKSKLTGNVNVNKMVLPLVSC